MNKILFQNRIKGLFDFITLKMFIQAKYTNNIHKTSLEHYRYFIHITNNVDKIISTQYIKPSSPSKSYSNGFIPAVFGYPNIPNKIIFYTEKGQKAIKIKLSDSLLKKIKIRKYDNAILLSSTDLKGGLLYLTNLNYEIIEIQD